MFNDRVRILDGGLASTLQEMGNDIDGHPLWSAKILHECPQEIYKVHSTFLDAGAEILITSSYQASLDGFEKYLGLSYKDSINLIKRSVSIAQTARRDYLSSHEGDVLIAGSVGPYGACLADGSEYTGNYINEISEAELVTWHLSRIEALVEAGVDLLAIETIPSLFEAKAILKTIANFPSIKAWVTFSCKNEFQTNFGDDFKNCVYELSALINKDQIVGVGINCSRPSIIGPLLDYASNDSHLPTLPIIVYPNLGETWQAGKGWILLQDSSESIESLIDMWLTKGAKVIGGCCRVGPKDIRMIKNKVANFNSAHLLVS